MSYLIKIILSLSTANLERLSKVIEFQLSSRDDFLKLKALPTPTNRNESNIVLD